MSRATVRAGLKSVLDTYRAANSTKLTQVYDHRPGQFNPPIAFVGGINEPQITHDSGIRQRQANAQIVVILRPSDNDSRSDRLDVLVDGILDALTAAPEAVTGSIMPGQMSVEDADIQIGEVTYVGSIISVRVETYEGRT